MDFNDRSKTVLHDMEGLQASQKIVTSDGIMMKLIFNNSIHELMYEDENTYQLDVAFVIKHINLHGANPSQAILKRIVKWGYEWMSISGQLIDANSSSMGEEDKLLIKIIQDSEQLLKS